MAKKRRIFEPGHGRKLMVVVDELPEVEGALFYAAGRVLHAGSVLLLYVIEPDNQFWEGVRQVQLEEQTNKARGFRLFRRKLNNEGYEAVPTEEVIREGKKLEEIVKQIDEDEDVAVLVLGASKEAAGPGRGLRARHRRARRQIRDPHHHRPRRPRRRGHQGVGLTPDRCR